jgi:hypothetical protein
MHDHVEYAVEHDLINQLLDELGRR